MYYYKYTEGKIFSLDDQYEPVDSKKNNINCTDLQINYYNPTCPKSIPHNDSYNFLNRKNYYLNIGNEEELNYEEETIIDEDLSINLVKKAQSNNKRIESNESKENKTINSILNDPTSPTSILFNPQSNSSFFFGGPDPFSEIEYENFPIHQQCINPIKTNQLNNKRIESNELKGNHIINKKVKITPDMRSRLLSIKEDIEKKTDEFLENNLNNSIFLPKINNYKPSSPYSKIISDKSIVNKSSDNIESTNSFDAKSDTVFITSKKNNF
jgi:hypothetical protein